MIAVARIRQVPRLLAAWTVLLVLLGVLAAALGWQVHATNQDADAGETALKAAEKYTVELLSYKPSSVERQLSDASQHLTGQFREDFTKLATTVVVPAAKRDAITTQTEIMAKSVVSASEDRVVTLLFVNQTTSSKAATQPKLTGSRLRVTLVRVDGDWLISDLTPL